MSKPELKKSPKGHGCQCGAYTYDECGCGVSWEDNDGYNNAIKEMNAWITHKLERVLDKSDVEHSIKELIKEVKR